MFKRIDAALRTAAAAEVTIQIDGISHVCSANDSVAAAIFNSGATACRDTPVSGTARGPFCMMGICYDCLVCIDGQPNQQACMTRVRDGMRIQRQTGAREVQA